MNPENVLRVMSCFNQFKQNRSIVVKKKYISAIECLMSLNEMEFIHLY